MARILVVDDQENVRALIEFLLQQEGHEVILAENGIDALAKLGIDPPMAAEPPALIFSDVMMPQLDGYSLCTRLAAEPKMRGVPIIIMTSKGATRELFQSLSAVVGFLEKPFDLTTLRGSVAAALKPRS